MTVEIHLTPSASAYIKKMQTEHPGQGFRLSIKKTGCSGYAYLPQMVEKISTQDFSQTFDNVTVYIDPSWAHVMQGLTIDYIEENKLGLKQKRLIFTNPNESARCGCGESFHVE